MKTTLLAALLLAVPVGAQQLSGDKVKVGVLTDMNGVYSALAGPGSVKAAELAAAAFMKKHPEYAGKVEVIGVDHQSKPDVATNKALEMIERDGVDAIFDVPTSSCALAVAGVVKTRNALLIDVGAGTTELTNEQCNIHTFHYAYDNWMLANGTGTAVTKRGGKTWFIIYPNYKFGQNLDAQMRKAVEAAGGKMVAPSEATPFPNTDFSSYLLKAQALKPQVFGTMHAGADLVNVVKQYNEFALKKDGIGLAIGLLFETDIDSLGQDAYAGAVVTVPWFWNLDAPSKAWSTDFQKAFGKKPSWVHGGVYSAVTTYLEAVARAKSDNADKVRAALEGHQFSDFFARNATIRPQDHRVILDVLQVEVKPKSEAKEERDYFKVISKTPAAQAFMPLSESKCQMGK
ncbi:MAG: ABC transporter substrate-binding protein [Myxococcaceae bacterium]